MGYEVQFLSLRNYADQKGKVNELFTNSFIFEASKNDQYRMELTEEMANEIIQYRKKFLEIKEEILKEQNKNRKMHKFEVNDYVVPKSYARNKHRYIYNTE